MPEIKKKLLNFVKVIPKILVVPFFSEHGDKLPLTFRVPYQSGASSSTIPSPSSGSDLGPVVDIFHGFSTLVLKPFFAKSFLP